MKNGWIKVIDGWFLCSHRLDHLIASRDMSSMRLQNPHGSAGRRITVRFTGWP